MRTIVQNTLIITLLYIFSISVGHAFNIDETVDDEIRKNYNPTQLINDVKGKNSALDKTMQNEESIKTTIDTNLPALPNISSTKKEASHNVVKNTTSVKPYSGGNIKVKSGTSFNVINTNTVSDWQRKGTKIKFSTTENTFGKN